MNSKISKLSRRDFMRTAGLAGTLFLPLNSFICKLGDNGWGSFDGNSLERILGEGTTVSISPNEVMCQTMHTFKIRITLGRGGMLSNDSFGIVSGNYINRWNMGFQMHLWGQEQPWQIEDSKAANFTTAQCSRPGARIILKVGTYGGLKPYCNQEGHFLRSIKERMRYVLELGSDTDLKEGDVITIIWGDQSGGGPGVKSPMLAINHYLLPFKYSLLPELDRELPIRRGEHLLLPTVSVKGSRAFQFFVTASPLHGINDRFSLNIAAIDKFANPAENFAGTVKLRCEGEGVRIPENVTMRSSDKGHLRIDGLQITKPGWYKIEASCGAIKCMSNYIKITEKSPSEQIHFGDMHSHTHDCDGAMGHMEHYNYARDFAGLDFGTISCHAEYFGSKKAWDAGLDFATRMNEPGRFVTFYGYEWARGKEGHTNVYFLNPEDVTLIYGDSVRNKIPDDPVFRDVCSSEKELHEKIRALQKKNIKTFLIAHIHTAYSDAVDDKLLWLDETYSAVDVDKKTREQRLRDNLERGLYLGVTGGSDKHILPMGTIHRREHAKLMGIDKIYKGYDGLQATFSKGLNRQDLYDGMKKRHVYATTGGRIVLLLGINGKNTMGDRVIIEKGSSPVLNIEVGGTDIISEIAICRFNGETWSEPFIKSDIGSDFWSGIWKDDDFEEKALYYVRVTQFDEENALSSPVWYGC